MRAAPVLCLILGTAGCAAKAASADLQYGFTVASQRARLAEAAVEDLQDKVVAMEAVLREQGLDRASGVQAMQQLGLDVASLRGEIEVLQFQVKEIRADLDQFRMDDERRTLHAEARLAQLEKVLGVQPPPPPRIDPVSDAPGPVAGDPPATPPVASSGKGGSADDGGSFEDRLSLAEKRMEEGQQAAARVILERALDREPKHPNAAEARYRVAETWFNEGKWKEAARKFQVVTDEHAKSVWAPWSMLRIGECFDGMGRADAAKTFYDGVVRNFPGTEAAKEAKKRLDK